MIKKLKDFFTFQDAGEIDISRRRFIKTAGALAALTVISAKAPSLFKIKELEEQIANGHLIGQTFYISEPIVIDIPNVLIDQCRFIATAPMDYMVQIGTNARNCRIQNSSFDMTGFSGGGIRIEPQPESIDMTTTFQSAIDAAQGGGGVTLAHGTYYTTRPLKMPSNFKLKGE